MLNRQQRRTKALFGLSDIALAALAFEAAYRTRILLQGRFSFEREFYLDAPIKALMLGFWVLAVVVVGRWMQIYDRLDSGSPRIILRDAFRQCATAAIALVLFEYLRRLDLSRPFLVFVAAYGWMFLCLFRLTAGNLVGLVRREFGAPHFVMIVGTGDRARRLGLELERSEPYGVRLLGFFSIGGAEGEIALRSSYRVFPIAQLRSILRRQVIDEIVFSVGTESLSDLEEVFLLCDEEGVRTRLALDFFPHVNSKVSLEQVGMTSLLTFSAAPNDEIRLLIKRATDLILAAAALLILTPFMLAIVVLVRLTSHGPAIFAQQRCGLNGRRFTFYKFRSMCVNADELKAKVQHLSRRSLATKIPNDPRLTPVGWFLRKFSIDEWPQLWNVLKGDMSLVGPRPAVPEEVDQYQQWQRRRLRMRPGLTCLWALNGRDSVDFETWMKMDMEYIDNWSLALDWKIILLTIPRVLIGSGAS